MDLGTFLGLASGISLVLGAIFMGGSLREFLDIASLMIVLGGTIASTCVAFPVREVMQAFSAMLQIFSSRKVSDAEVVEMRYPVAAYPAKIASFDLDKDPVVEGTLQGIKGQYLIFDTGVINIRKYTDYQLAVQQLARQQYEAALEGLLKLFVRNRSYGDGLPHKTLLQVFDLLGGDHPLVTSYRRKLYQAIY